MRHLKYRTSGYVSEFTQFLDHYMADHPAVSEDQMHGWYIWWDRPADPIAEQRAKRDEVPQPPYVYP